MLLRVILGCLLVVLITSYKCIHNEISRKIRLVEPDPQLAPLYKLSAFSTETPMRITNSYHSYLSPSQPNMDETILRMISIAREFWRRVLSVQSTKIMFPLSENNCAEFPVPSEDRKPKDSDLHLFVTSHNSPNESFIAWAAACAIAPNGRPIFGQINFNAYYISVTNKTNYQFQKDLETTIHEMIHVLGFSPSLFAYWVNKPIILKQYNFTTLASSEITKWMKSHFNCNLGAPLENQGGEGSIGAHWDRSVFQNEIMTASDMSQRLIFSNLTMALLASTGWYKVDQSMAEGFIWGKGEGCGFISTLCKGNFPEFCYNSGMISCTYDNTAIASCISDSFSDSCSYYSAYKNTICQQEVAWGLPNTGSVFQYDSRCFKSNIIQSKAVRMNLDFRCFKAKCVGGSVLVTIANTLEILCEKANQVININNSSYQGFLKCPQNLAEFCMAARYTEGYCYQHGYSINGQCICAEGYNGSNCNSSCGATHYLFEQSCVVHCPEGTRTWPAKNTCVHQCPESTYQQDDSCIECPLYCVSCSNNECAKCMKGSQITNGTCVPIIPLDGRLYGLGLWFLILSGLIL